MNAIVFGTGEVGKSVASFIEKQHHILFWTDNNEKKWGTVFENYLVKPPKEIKKYDCSVVIASTKYEIEIAGQLEQMGIGKDRIYFCRKFQTDNTYEYEIYPCLVENLSSTGKTLAQYDLYCAKEDKKANCKKVLIFCIFYSTYTKQLIENMSKRYKDIEFSLLTNAKDSKENILSEQLKHIYYFETMADLKSILDQLPVYDAMQLLWMEREWVYFSKDIREKARRLNLHVGGSDFYRSTDAERCFRRNLIKCADCVIVQTEGTRKEFEAYYGEDVKDKTILLPYGIEVLELIDRIPYNLKNKLREKYHITQDRIVITCGHNANDAHQHIKLIDALEKLPQNVKKLIICVFPMTYPKGCDTYIQRVCERLEKSGLDYVVLRKFMDFQEMAEYALISDVMIHVQTTDQLSSAMLEEMYSGAVVIAGKWLPYRSLHEMGIFFLDVDEICDTTKILEEVIINKGNYKEKCIGNKEIVRRHSSWDELAPRWRMLWD